MYRTACAIADSGVEEGFLPPRLTVRLGFVDAIFILEVIERDGRVPKEVKDIFAFALVQFARAANGETNTASGDFKMYVLFYEALVGPTTASLNAKKEAVSTIIRWCMDMLERLMGSDVGSLPSPTDRSVLLATLRDISAYAESQTPPGD
ncbi:hypothetical protein HY624_02745 [Candidatus Uhrbacteria bacterium]|nr:hypothetical protein [Candidatus Uhrbacteria bacterium]